MPRYPGQQVRRWPFVAVAGIVALLAGLGAGWMLAPRASGSATHETSCPGGRDVAGRRAAAACLVASYFSLENASPAARDSKLADIVLPAELAATRTSYQALPPNVSTEYSAVAATNVVPSQTRPDTDASGQAWVAFVDSYKDGSPPLAQWWITTFSLRWQDGRWWLSGGVGMQVNATPPSTGAAPRTGFGPGWVAVGRA